MPRKFKDINDQLNYDYIQELKLKMETSGVPKILTADGQACYIRVINRGEQMFFQLDEKAFICEISTHDRLADARSIKKWDDGTKISDPEKQLIIKEISKYWLKDTGEPIRFIGKGGQFLEDIQ